jgi:hypothetical protein
VAQLTDLVCLLILGEEEVFCGSTFPINDAHRLYLGAAHSIPEGREDDLRIMAFLDSGLKVTRVTDVEVLAQHPDVVALQAEDGLPPRTKLAADEAYVWEQVCAVGYPEVDIRELESGNRTADVRGLVGSVSRKVEAGQALAVKAAAYEVSFAIPNGLSGGPVFAMDVGVRRAFVGVCLGNSSTSSTIYYEAVETSEGQIKTTQESRIIEYGVVANLNRYADEPIGLVGKTLRQLMGSEAGQTSAG